MLRGHAETAKQFQERWDQKGITGILDELEDLESLTARADFWDDPERAKKTSMKKSELEKRTQPWRDLRRDLDEFPDLVDLTLEEVKDQKAAIEGLEGDLHKIRERLEDTLLAEALTGEDDGRDAIVTISSGAGGTESQDWTEMLLRMYLRWFEKRGFRVETADIQQGEEAGIKNATLIVRGENAFGLLNAENGVHRLVRISPFDSNKRRHTSFAAVHVTPDIDDSIIVNIDEKDLRIDTYRSSGAGGQHVNKTDSAVRITHNPTGIVVQCQNERSQMKNKSTAMKMLKARLHELEKRKLEDDIESRSGEKRDVAWGSQIRSYVMHPYKLVKDLRTDYETGNVDAVMDGDLDPFVNAYLKSLAGMGPALKAGEKAE
ncbi:MAG: peptide chain release factor 2 [Leptospirales bacterium]|nr:peptide chain release factor 2 [Leptospirales bacterium]